MMYGAKNHTSLPFYDYLEENPYGEEMILNSDDSINMQALPDVAIALDAMFPMAENLQS